MLSLSPEKLKASTYSEHSIEELPKSYFERLNSNVVSFVVDKKQMSIEDLELVLKELKNKLIYLLKVDELIATTYCHKVFT
jgi:hypothetical protein